MNFWANEQQAGKRALDFNYSACKTFENNVINVNRIILVDGSR